MFYEIISKVFVNTNNSVNTNAVCLCMFEFSFLYPKLLSTANFDLITEMISADTQIMENPFFCDNIYFCPSWGSYVVSYDCDSRILLLLLLLAHLQSLAFQHTKSLLKRFYCKRKEFAPKEK